MSGAVAPFEPTWFGTYLAIDRLGAGAMGDVLLARPAQVGAPPLVVIKRLHAELTKEEAFAKRFRHEAEVATAIDSPRIVKVLDAGRAGGSLYIAMEHVEGWTLQRLLRELAVAKRRPSLASVVAIVSGILEGLDAIHSSRDPTGRDLGVVHRDLAPKNVMIRSGGAITIIDLGLGKSKAQDWKTRTGTILGSPGYMAPEQVRAASADHRADLYAAAVMLYELAAVKPYIPRASVPEMLARALMPETVEAACRAVPPALAEVLRRGLAVDPNARHSSARELLGVLRSIPIDSTGDPSVLEIVGPKLEEELDQSRRRIDELMAASDAEVQHTEVIQPVEVFSRREASGTEDRIRTMPFPPPVSFSLAPRSVVLLVLASGAAMFVLGMLIERVRSPAPMPAPILEALEPARESRELPIVVPRPDPMEAPPRVEVAPTPPRPPRPAVADPPQMTEPPPQPKPAPPAPPSLEERVDRMIDRAKVSMQDAARRDAARDLLQRLTRLRSSPRLHLEADRVEALEAEIDAL
jgi:serine/threonine-protein kinase